MRLTTYQMHLTHDISLFTSKVNGCDIKVILHFLADTLLKNVDLQITSSFSYDYMYEVLDKLS